jgi:dTDP-4-amino-4,6-dideoxygalactose transaminase
MVTSARNQLGRGKRLVQMIPFVDVKTQFKRIEEEVRRRINAVLDHGQFILGPEVAELEQKLAAFAGIKHCVSCASGTDALYMALLAKGIGPGDAVFTPSFTFFATAEVIALLGATPVFVDVDPATFNIDPVKLEKAIEALAKDDPSLHPLPRTPGGARSLAAKGVIAVDLFGLPADYDALHAVSRKHRLWLMEDAAQSFGAEYKSKRAGALAEISCTSFYPAKPLGAYGDGGAIFTNDDALAQTLRSIRVHGQGSDVYEHVRLGITGRLDSLQAAVLLAKLPIFASELEERQRIADRYTGQLARLAEYRPPMVPKGYRSAWAHYSVLCPSAERRTVLRDKLRVSGIPTGVYYPIALHRQRAFAGLGYERGTMPVSEDLSGRIFGLPMHPYLLDTTIDAIVSMLKAA